MYLGFWLVSEIFLLLFWLTSEIGKIISKLSAHFTAWPKISNFHKMLGGEDSPADVYMVSSVNNHLPH